MARYVVGIDAGTESIRAGVYDETGNCLAFGVSPNATEHAKPAWAEQSPEAWTNALTMAIKKAIHASGVSPSQIEGVGVDGTSCTVLFLSKDGTPLRDAIMWMDVRSSEEAAEIARCGDPALEYVGFANVSAEWFPCKVLWTKRNEPDVYEKATTIFEQTDWLVYFLTGETTANINTTTIRWFYNSRKGGFPSSFYRTIGLGDIEAKLPSRVLDIGEVAGYVTPKVARETGLPAGIPVAAGGADAYMGVIGVNALTPGQVALITGSSHLHLGLSTVELHGAGLFGSFPDAVIPGFHVVEAGQISTGSVIKWFTTHFVNSQIESEAQSRNASVYDILNEKAAMVPPGSEGLLVLEHWQGNRTPWVDARSRGVVRGLSLKHGPEHVYRAIMEGVVYGTAVILRRMEANGFQIKEMIASGGVTNSALWTQLHADITGKPIVVPQEQQAVSLGSAIAATVAVGIYGSLTEAANNMVRIARTLDPDTSNSAVYTEYVDQYERTYDALKDLSDSLVRFADRPLGRVGGNRDEEILG